MTGIHLRTASEVAGLKPVGLPAGLLHSRWDGLLIALAVLHGVALVGWPSMLLIAVGLWWNANTVAHNFIHRPFFRYRAFNRAFSVYLSLLLGVPQTLWRARHLAHHARTPVRVRPTKRLMLETAVVVLLWLVLAWAVPQFFFFTYLPGCLLGLGLGQLQGYFEHWRGTVSHYGWVYNFLFFNDGYHVEHHAAPGRHWRELPQFRRAEAAFCSRWPACMRWLEIISLDAIEKLVLHWPALQRFVLSRHERALRKLMPRLGLVREVAVVGGGLFPRTLLILEKLWPKARILVIDASRQNIEAARRFLQGRIAFEHRLWAPADDGWADLVVIPLAFRGDRAEVYRNSRAGAVLVHDWIWRRRGEGVVISWLLLKRMNLVYPDRTAAPGSVSRP